MLVIDDIKPHRRALRRAIINVSYEVLERAMGLNDDHCIIGLISRPEDIAMRTVKVIISGPNCPEVPEGWNIPSFYDLAELQEIKGR